MRSVLVTVLVTVLLAACARPDPLQDLDPTLSFGEEYARLEVPASSSLWVDTGRAFLCTGGQGLYVVSVADLFDPWLEDIVDIECHAVDGETGRVEVAAGEAGLAVVHPGNLSIIGSYATDYPLTALTVEPGERQAWLAGRATDPDDEQAEILVVEGVVTYSAEHLEQNRWAGFDAADVLGIAFDGDGLFIARADGRIDVLGRTMELRSSIEDVTVAGGAGAGFLAGDGTLWAAMGAAGIRAWDVSSLEAPTPVAEWTGGGAWGLARIDDRLYVGSDEALVVLDIADPARPVELGRVDLAGMARPEGIYVIDRVAWITDADGGALAIVDIDEATLP
ncbi:MAG: hypothetical protein D6798_12235 [Deltaproteobacteria bacterium]|nr:MAG: hypothetical protein D6798_12235 [Deltaproteobacteria bacterium]